MIKTTHGTLALGDSGQETVPVLLIHGNSTCRDVFRHQMEGPLANKYRLLAIDFSVTVNLWTHPIHYAAIHDQIARQREF